MKILSRVGHKVWLYSTFLIPFYPLFLLFSLTSSRNTKKWRGEKKSRRGESEMRVVLVKLELHPDVNVLNGDDLVLFQEEQ